MGDFSGKFRSISEQSARRAGQEIRNLGLPLGLRGRRVSTEAVHLVVQGREVRIDIPEPTSLYCASG